MVGYGRVSPGDERQDFSGALLPRPPPGYHLTRPRWPAPPAPRRRQVPTATAAPPPAAATARHCHRPQRRCGAPDCGVTGV